VRQFTELDLQSPDILDGTQPKILDADYLSQLDLTWLRVIREATQSASQTRRPDCLPQISSGRQSGDRQSTQTFYVDVIDLAEKFHIAPHIIYEEWPVEWIDRIF
jgi:hypothetical protein